ncbi:cconjugal transfer pilus assembly protein TrbC [Klebsiella aerogenes]|nr:cconjugal transfer pilus assembly protein TrbC [Klebsiella aerogenes]
MKLLNILTVMLLLTRTVAAAEGAVSSDPMAADRQWLKQQEDFSEQLRRHPDKALQQDLEAQISRNPLPVQISSSSIIWPVSSGSRPG